MVRAGHLLAAAAAFDVLRAGGNAIDSGMANLCVPLWPDWEPRAGSLGAVVVDAGAGFRYGAADPRWMAYAVGW